MHCTQQQLWHCKHSQAVLLMQAVQSQVQQPCKPFAGMCDGINKPGGGSSSVVQDLADQMASLRTEQWPASTWPAAADSSAPAADSLPNAAQTGAISLLAVLDASLNT